MFNIRLQLSPGLSSSLGALAAAAAAQSSVITFSSTLPTDDTMTGGDSDDYWMQNSLSDSDTLDMYAGQVSKKEAGKAAIFDVIKDIEAAIGSCYADIMSDSAFDNRIDGAGGNDTMFCRAGNDTLAGAAPVSMAALIALG